MSFTSLPHLNEYSMDQELFIFAGLGIEQGPYAF
jgi:hypothetical protein